MRRSKKFKGINNLYYYLNQILTTYIAIIIWQYSSRTDNFETLNYLLFGNIILSLTLLNKILDFLRNFSVFDRNIF